MANIHYEIAVDRPASEVWQLIADFGGVYRYNPNVKHSRSTSASVNQGVGATRHCDLTFSGASVEERILEWREGEGYTLEMFDGVKLPPFKGPARAALAVRAAGAGRSVVVGDLSYEMRFGLIGRLMDKAVVRPRFGPAFGSTLVGIKHFAETGEEVTERTDLSAESPSLRPPARSSTPAPAPSVAAR